MHPHTWALFVLALFVLMLTISHVRTSRNVALIFRILQGASAGDLRDIRNLIKEAGK